MPDEKESAMAAPESQISPGLDPEMRNMVLDTLDRAASRLFPTQRVLALDKDGIFPEADIRALFGPEIGLQLLFIPEEFGGMGGNATDCCAVTRRMSGVCLGISTGFFAVQLGLHPILTAGTAAQKEKWLGKVADGGALVAYAVTEPDAGSNVAALKTRAEPETDADGNLTGYRIFGNKQFISNGGYADFMTVLAATPQGPSFFIVTRDDEGFSRGKAEKKHGIRASDTSALVF